MPLLQAPHTYVCVFVLVDTVEVEGPAVDKELRAGDVDGADTDRERVHVLQQGPVCLCLHFHLDFQGGDASDVLGLHKDALSSLPLVCKGCPDFPSIPQPCFGTQPAPHRCFSRLLWFPCASSGKDQGLTKQKIEIQAGEAEG